MLVRGQEDGRRRAQVHSLLQELLAEAWMSIVHQLLHCATDPSTECVARTLVLPAAPAEENETTVRKLEKTMNLQLFHGSCAVIAARVADMHPERLLNVVWKDADVGVVQGRNDIWMIREILLVALQRFPDSRETF